MGVKFAATRYGREIEDLLLQVSATLQKAGDGKGIDSEIWMMNWLDTLNSAFNGVYPRILLQASEADLNRLQIE